jgi:glycosyltransferase involved in cell wall biosynthesis
VGQPTGIQRTLMGLVYGSKLNDSVKIVAINPLDDKYYEVSKKRFLDIFHEKGTRNDTLIKKGNLLRTIAFNITPYFIAKKYESKNKEKKKKIKRFVSIERKRFDLSKKFRFQNGDCILVIDSNWDYENYIEIIRKTILTNFDIKIAAFVHDIIPISHPQFVDVNTTIKLTKWVNDLLSVSELTYTNSNFTKNELLDYCKKINITPREVKVIRFGNNFNNIINKDKKNRGDIILWVGSMDMRKNPECIIQAYKKVVNEGIELPDLVLVGRESRNSKHITDWITKTPEIKKNIIWLDNVDEEELDGIYDRTSLFVFTSWVEGYGLPVDEALVRGIPTIASNASAIPEVGGNAAEYFKPHDVDELAELIRKFFTDSDYKNSLINKSMKHPTHDWDKTIEQIKNGFKKLV